VDVAVLRGWDSRADSIFTFKKTDAGDVLTLSHYISILLLTSTNARVETVISEGFRLTP
jgi:hypothetical protein